MANHKSALKRAKQNEARKLRNRATKSTIKTAVKKIYTLKADASEDTKEMFQNAQSIIAKGAKKGVIHKNTAARKISRLAKYVNKLSLDAN